MPRFVSTPDAYRLLHDGSLALAEMERAGFRVDTAYLATALTRTSERIRELEDELRADPIYKLWRRRFGEKTKLGAPDQLAAVVYGDLGYAAKRRTKGGKRGAADESAFEGVDLPFVRKYFATQKIRKARGTYLIGIDREKVLHDDGCHYVHAHANLNTVTTFRSSYSDPNLQNQPARDPAMAEMVRRSFIPRPGHQLIEIDFNQAEVRVGACYHRDPNLVEYVGDPKKDMHRDAARRLFFLKESEVAKPVRGLAKGDFVFAEFYGSFYAQVARGLWEGSADLRTKDGTQSLRERLAERGIAELGACDFGERPVPGTFEAHVRGVENWLWDDMFPGYKQWKRDWFAEYQRNGGFQMLTGFAVNGFHKRNDVTNYPIQGSSFHCLLLALIRIVRRLKKLRMRSRVVCEIHDNLVGDVHPRERDDFIEICLQEMTERVPQTWDWITVPLSASVEVCEPDASWFDKVEWKQSGDGWAAPT